MAYDVARIRSWFPSLESGWAQFDGPGGTQTPRQVGEAVASVLTGPLSNRGSIGVSEQRAEEAVHGFRLAMADLVNADPRGIVQGRSATQLVYDFSRHLSRQWGVGDEVVVTRLDHDSNVRPWVQAAERVGATVRWADFDPETGELPVDAVTGLLSDRTRLVAVTAASNLLGTQPDLPAIAAAVHDAGALLFVDGVHLTAHELPDVAALGADFFTCSPYKFLGPHCGVLVARPELLETITPDKLLPATNAVPERFEFGTLPYELLAGVTAAVEVLASLDTGAPDAASSRRERLVASYAALHEHEASLAARLGEGLAALPRVTVWSRAERRTPTVLMTFDGIAAEDVTRRLAEDRVLAPSGNFYALEASRRLGLGDEGGLRVGLAPYTDQGDVERLLGGLRAALA
ncbi:cysteine desulfurase family protein (TIGR01976 family) [Agromyces flavus]|uniref:Cysteine desulfurase family protein (TIGR01976 family) n=1 Tax=Agromyces flavus TaxID=589382 RepID=A0A1H1YHR0_9MICO|nr:cysteine desulfurase-like protein [Agromyces flavus]MCP2366697.1 cysteine desulfurase family protein (TIGR01976 family) [Agromyces flavus]GGI45194.1 cysteine desulfurase-like protein [Agromyces flavus]SDT20967.1 cysteine desulfurase family protein, VC1184 subfamily [Agromyces flavus]